MTRTTQEAIELSECSEKWLRGHVCAWCDQTILNALRYGCGAVWERCEPEKKYRAIPLEKRP